MEDELEYAKRRSKRNRKRCIVTLSVLLILLLIIGIVVVIILVVVPLFKDKEESGEFRLPTSIVPHTYALEIRPYLSPDNLTFDGGVNITVTCVHSTDKIILHSSGLDIHQATVTDVMKGSNVAVKSTETVSKYELLVLHLKRKLRSNQMYQLQFIFGGKLGTTEGFYWRPYIDKYGLERHIAATKFKPTYARRAFPCFDEPAYKTTFDVTLLREGDGSYSLSNARHKKTGSREDGWTVDTYQSSIKISTCHVAFYISSGPDNPVQKRIDKLNMTVRARTESIQLVEYALGAAMNASEFYISKFGSHIYPSEIELIAIPDDGLEDRKRKEFDATGEESSNWGLIMLDESLMAISRRGEEWEKEKSAKTVTHHVAHQLFGNLVSPKWWSDAWLMESVSTYIGILALDDKINPKWKSLETLKRSSDYVEYDCSESSQALSTVVKEASDVLKPFNHALYKKGARLMNMAHGLLKDNRFWQGLLMFLQDKAFNVSVPNDLWSRLTKTQNTDVNRIDFEAVMKSWVQNRGHPIVTLTRNYNLRTGVLSQTSCLNESTMWNIPITYIENTAKKNQEPEIHWLDSTNKTIYRLPDTNQWVLLNGELNAFFHVNYDMENWKLLAKQLSDDFLAFPVETRYRLLYDAHFLARMNKTSYDVLLDMLSYMKIEDISVKELLAEVRLSEIWKMLRMSNVDQKWKTYVLDVIGSTYRDLFDEYSAGKDDLFPRMYLKREIATLACFCDKKPCVNHAKKKSEEWLKEEMPFKDITTLDHHLVRPYLCTAVRKENSIGDKIYNFFKSDKGHEYLVNNTGARDMMYALGCSESTYGITVYMEKFIIEDGDPESFVESMLNSHNGSSHLFEFLKFSVNTLKNNYVRLELVFKRLSEAVANPIELQKMNEVFDSFKEEMKKEDSKTQAKRIEKLLNGYAEKAEERLQVVSHQIPAMVQWLKQYRSRR